MGSISSLPKRGQTHGDVNRKLSGFDTVERIAQPMADSSEHLSKRLLLSSEDVHCDPEFPISQQRLANMCFFLIGIGVAIGWTVCRSGISYFAMKFPIGWTFYSYATAAYNFPALPVLLCQTLYDGKVDDMYGSSRTYTVRLVFAFVAMTASLATVPLGTQTSTLVSIALVGVFDSVAYGTASQFFSMFSASTAGFYLLGASCTSLMSIALTFATGFNEVPPTALAADLVYWVGAGFVLVGLVAATVLLRSDIGSKTLAAKDAASKRHRVQSLQRGNSDLSEDAEALMMLQKEEPQAADEAWQKGNSPQVHAYSNTYLYKITWSCHAALFLCWASTNIVAPVIGFVPSQSDTVVHPSMTFRMVIMYASLLGELGGKLLNLNQVTRVIKRPQTLFVCVIIRFLFVIPFLLYILQPLYTANGTYHVRNDALYIAFQVCFDMSGSYLSSMAYSIAPGLLPHAALRPQSSTLLAITLTLGVYAGLGTSIGVTQVLRRFPPTCVA